MLVTCYTSLKSCLLKQHFLHVLLVFSDIYLCFLPPIRVEHPPSHVNWTLSVVTSFGHETVACYVTECKSGGNTTDKFNSTHSVCCKLTKLRGLSTVGGKSWLIRPVGRGGRVRGVCTYTPGTKKVGLTGS